MRKKDDKKIEAVKKTVIKLIRDYGFHGISMAKIAKEAEVSPATIYIYYENKSIMIHEIYHELRTERHNYLHKNVTSEMNAKVALKNIYKSYYNYIINHGDEFYFIKQFSSCPCLYDEIHTQQYSVKLDSLLNKFKENREVKDLNNKIIVAILFSPIESIAEDFLVGGVEFSEEEIDKMFELVWKSICF